MSSEAVEIFKRKLKNYSLAELRKMTRGFIGAVKFAKTPELKKEFEELATIGKEELARNKWSV